MPLAGRTARPLVARPQRGNCRPGAYTSYCMNRTLVHLFVAVVILALAWAYTPALVALIVTALAVLSFLGYL
jgi:hypothetical protein